MVWSGLEVIHIKSGGKARRGEYVAGPGARGGGTLPTLYCRSVVVAGSRLLETWKEIVFTSCYTGEF